MPAMRRVVQSIFVVNSPQLRPLLPDGRAAISMAQWASISLPIRTSHNPAQNYALSMMIKGDSPGTKFQLRFTDTKTAVAGDHPWRMNFTVDETIAAWDNKWHKVFIPLPRFAEGGSWDNVILQQSHELIRLEISGSV